MKRNEVIEFMKSINADVNIHYSTVDVENAWGIFERLGVHEDDVIVHHDLYFDKMETTIDGVDILVEVSRPIKKGEMCK